MPYRFEEDIALQERMCAIGGIIQDHDFPHFICFQVHHHHHQLKSSVLYISWPPHFELVAACEVMQCMSSVRWNSLRSMLQPSMHSSLIVRCSVAQARTIFDESHAAEA